MSSKAALKAAKAALDNEQYDLAIQHAETALGATGSQQYLARLILGRAYEKQGKLVDAVNSYRSVAESKPDDIQAWQGLISVYGQQGSVHLDQYQEAVVKCAETYITADDQTRCQNTVDAFIKHVKAHGNQAQVKKSLELLLPGTPIYDFLEGRLQPPVVTYTRIAEITESEESRQMETDIKERRTRIGARLDQVTLEVKREVYGKSELESLYQKIIDWSNDDEMRRQYEEKLLERADAHLAVLPMSQKAAKLDQVLSLAEGMVIIHHPFQLAWDLVLESRDMDDLRDLDVNVLREYIAFFPNSGLSRVLQGWLSSELSPFPAPKSDTVEKEEVPEELSPDDRLLLFTDGLSDAGLSPLAHRLVSDYYLHLEEYSPAIKTADAGLTVLDFKSKRLGLSLQNTKDAINSVWATSTVYDSPRYHPEAKELFEDILQRKPKFTPALIGLGLIFKEREEYANADNFLTRALAEDKSNVRVGTELAWCKALVSDYLQAKIELEDLLPLLKEDNPRTRELRAQTIYRIGVCIWYIDPSRTARKDRNGAYSHFLSAIKTNVNYAPPYTSLGFYYADYAKDKKRARQCFQKAFELSAAEVEAAERLAQIFANQGDWEIVEVIARRVIDSGRARPPPGSKKKGISWPHSALGVVQMNRQEYQQAVVSFLAALRIQPTDYQSYVGLGESYHNSGRYNSALRTFHYALEPHDGLELKITGETWFARYMLANVHRELGEHEEAINGLKGVLTEQPSEFGVLISLLQTYVERSWHCIEAGLFGQAIQSAVDAIETAYQVAANRPHAFNLWKAVGDACSIFSWAQSGVEKFPLERIKALLDLSPSSEMFEPLATIDRISEAALDKSDADNTAQLPQPLIAAILAYKRAIDACASDIHARAVAWYNLGWAEQRASMHAGEKSRKRYLNAAVRSFKRAIELEAGNSEFWNSLGVVVTTINPKVAQHSFVRSLHLNELNAKVWTNLGTLYLFQNDFELAHQAFGRSQSTDPDYAHAWLGEGLVAMLTGNSQEALNHFTHAFEISDSSSIGTKKQYTTASFDYLLSSPSASNDLTKLIQPIFALEQLQTQAPHDLPYQHLAALFMERVGNHNAAIETLSTLSASAEIEYEKTESMSSLARFAHAKSDLSRNQLAAGDFSTAAENAETALDLSADANTCGLDIDSRRKLRLSAHLTAGLAQFHLQNFTSSIDMFRAALDESSNDPDVVCSLVQVLWAQGGAAERGVARDQLFQCVEEHPEHARAVMLMGAMAALDDDRDTAAAVRDDLVTLRTRAGIVSAEQAGIDFLLASLAALAVDGGEEDVLREAQVAIMLDPSRAHAWSELAELSGSAAAAEMALKTAAKSVPPFGDTEAAAVAKAFAGVGTVANAQRAIVLAPWEKSGWESMKDALSV